MYLLGGEPPVAGTPSPVYKREVDCSTRRLKVLKRVDRELSKGNFKTALSLVKQLRSLRGFGAAKQVSKRVCSLDELDLKLNENEMSSLRSLINSVIESVETSTDFASLDEHEAGHFLVGYLLGILPKGYMVPSIEALRQRKLTAARVEFVGFEFLKEVAIPGMSKKDTIQLDDRAKGSKISSKTLNNFSCVILGGLAAEHMVFGYSEGHHADINKLERVFRWLNYGKSEANHQTKWAALNTALILHHQTKAISKLAEAMSMQKPISSCINTIEHLTHM